MSEKARYTPRHIAAFGQHRDDAQTSGAVVLRDVSIIVLIALLCAMLIKNFIFQPFYIPSSSMESTLEINDRIIVSRWVPKHSEINRGDIVVFKDPGGWLDLEIPTNSGIGGLFQDVLTTVGLMPETSSNHLIKRVIGTGGDHVTCCNEDGLIEVNGTPITETYLKEGSIPSQIDFDVIVPERHLWVLGDNRQNSGDSREHMGLPGGGFIPLSEVVGRASLKIWPLSRGGGFGDASPVFADVPEP